MSTDFIIKQRMGLTSEVLSLETGLALGLENLWLTSRRKGGLSPEALMAQASRALPCQPESLPALAF